MNGLLKKYLSLVDFLADILGKDAEVVLHDLTDISKSVVAIRNGYISGRKVGAPATNLVIKILNDVRYSDQDYLVNYKGVSINGETLKSSTYFIRDNKRKLIGMLCVNIDIKKMVAFRDHFDSFLHFLQEEKDEPTTEKFTHSIDELTFDSIENEIERTGIPPERMSKDEKLLIVKKLNESGVFILKGAVNQTASRLKVSEATLYRYISTIKKEGKN